MVSGLNETHQIRGYRTKRLVYVLTQTTVPLSAFNEPVRFEGEVVKRIRMLRVLGMLAVALPIGLLPGVAEADDSGGRRIR